MNTFLFCITALSALCTVVQQSCMIEELLAKLPAVRIGAGVAGISRERYIMRLTWLRELLRFNIMNFRDKQSFVRITNALEVLKLDDSNGEIRKQPYCVLLTGVPGCGKSNYALKIAMECLRAKYGSAYPNDIVTLNETDEFQSEFRNNHKIVIFDDLGAENFNFTTVNPWRKVLDFVNNIRKTSLNPNVEMKGNVYIEPDIVIITTNLKKTLGVCHFMNSPGAIYRRINKYLVLSRDYTKTKVGKWDVGSYENSRAFDSGVQGITISEEFDRDSIMNDIVKEFLDHDTQQECFIRKTNILFNRKQSFNVGTSIYYDLIYPLLPKAILMDDNQLNKMSWFDKLKYALSIKVSMPIIQSQEIFEEQGGFEDEYTSQATIRRYLNKTFDFEWYGCIRSRIPENAELNIYKDVVMVDYNYAFSKTLMSKQSESYEGIVIEKKSLDDLYFKYLQQSDVSQWQHYLELKDNDDSSLCYTSIDDSDEESEIDIESIMTYKLNQIPKMDKVLEVTSLTSQILDDHDIIKFKNIVIYPKLLVLNHLQKIVMLPSLPLALQCESLWNEDYFLYKSQSNIQHKPDPGIADLLLCAKKKSIDLKVVGYEFKYSNGKTSDLILSDSDKNLYVIELKSGNGANVQQLIQYMIATKKEFSEYSHNKIFGILIRTGRTDIILPNFEQKPDSISQYTNQIKKICDLLDKYIGRCGATELSN